MIFFDNYLVAAMSNLVYFTLICLKIIEIVENYYV